MIPMPVRAAPRPAPPAKAAVVGKAALRAADRLGISARALARIVGVSEPTLSRMKKGAYRLEADGKPYELALLFVRLYRSLDAIVDGDDDVAAAWLKNDNAALGGAPLSLIQSVAGLTAVIAYLDARRALV
jgi:transcriptional regulator with XRE-family HTH domain